MHIQGLHYFLDFMYVCENKMTKKRKKELCCKSKRARRLIGVTSLSLGDFPARQEDHASENFLYLMKLAVVNAFLCSPTTVLENSLDDTK
jgi:hypothetical protein